MEEPTFVHPQYNTGAVDLVAPFARPRWQPVHNDIRSRMSQKMQQLQKIDQVSAKTVPSMSNAKNVIVRKAKLPRVKSNYKIASESELQFVPAANPARSTSRLWNNLQVTQVPEKSFHQRTNFRDMRVEALNKKREAYKERSEARKVQEEKMMRSVLNARKLQ
jgi:hypothetical protein